MEIPKCFKKLVFLTFMAAYSGFLASLLLCQCSIRIFNGCLVRTENSVMRVTLRHHKACRVMPNSYPKWQNFQFPPNNHFGFFFLHTTASTIAFKRLYALFSQYNAEISTFSVKKYSAPLLPMLLSRKSCRKNMTKYVVFIDWNSIIRDKCRRV